VAVDLHGALVEERVEEHLVVVVAVAYCFEADCPGLFLRFNVSCLARRWVVVWCGGLGVEKWGEEKKGEREKKKERRQPAEVVDFKFK
jgi:hypothetical protein